MRLPWILKGTNKSKKGEKTSRYEHMAKHTETLPTVEQDSSEEYGGDERHVVQVIRRHGHGDALRIVSSVLPRLEWWRHHEPR